MASEGHSQAPKFPVPSSPYNAGAPMLPPTSYANEHHLPQAEFLEQQNQLDEPIPSKRTKTTRRAIAIVVFIALLGCVCAVILVLRYRPEQRVVVWVLVGLIGLLATVLLVLLFPTCPSTALSIFPSPAMF